MKVLAAYEVAEAGSALDAVRYSRYKHGSAGAVAAFAETLAGLAVATLPGLLDGPVTITAPASRSVPIGADLLADGVLRAVNHERAQRGTGPAVRAKLHRFAVPAGDYGGLSGVDRRALLAAERISGIPELFAGRDVVIVDDLWVTGASAEVTVDAVARYAPRSVTYLVIATVEPGYAARRPEVEAELNHAAVDSLKALGDLGPMTVNQRVCKFVLRQEPRAIGEWLEHVPAHTAWQLYAGVLAEGFLAEPGFADAARVIVNVADGRDLDAAAATHGWGLGG
ncbi:hypothetical protein GCM10009558_088620 [Virgisporangium aurantiacum]